MKSLVDKVCDQNIKIKRVFGEKREVEIQGRGKDKEKVKGREGLYNFY